MKKNIDKKDAVKAFGKAIVKEYKKSTNKGLFFSGIGAYVLSKLPILPIDGNVYSLKMANFMCTVTNPSAEVFGEFVFWQCKLVRPVNFLLPIIIIGLIGYYLYINLWLNK